MSTPYFNHQKPSAPLASLLLPTVPEISENLHMTLRSKRTGDPAGEAEQLKKSTIRITDASETKTKLGGPARLPGEKRFQKPHLSGVLWERLRGQSLGFPSRETRTRGC